MKSEFPAYDPAQRDDDAEAAMELVMGVIKAVRNIKGEMGISPGKNVDMVIKGGGPESRETIEGNGGLISVMAKLDTFSFIEGEAPQGAATAIVGDLEVFVPLEGHVDLEEEEKRLEKELAKIAREVTIFSRKLANKDFIERAPEKVIEKDKAKLAEAEMAKSKLEESLERIRCLK